jgi:hypothetical protein
MGAVIDKMSGVFNIACWGHWAWWKDGCTSGVNLISMTDSF